jgi:hypothetical protein
LHPDLRFLALWTHHFSGGCRRVSGITWCVVAKELKAAALGADPIGVSVALRMALSLEGVECRPQ